MRWSIPSQIIQEGRKLVQEKRVIKVIPNEEEKLWFAEVLDDDKYHVALDGTAKENDTCDCEDWRRKHYCRHTIAVELFLKENQTNRVMTQNKGQLFHYPADVLNQHLDVDHLFSTFMDQLEEKEVVTSFKPIKVDLQLNVDETSPYQFSDDVMLYFRLRLGTEQLHTINNLTRFFQALLEEGNFDLGGRNHEKVALVKQAFDPKMYELLTQLAYPYLEKTHWAVNVMQLFSNKQLQQRYYLDRDQLGEWMAYENEEHSTLSFRLTEDRHRPNWIENRRPVVFEILKSDAHYQLRLQPTIRFLRFYNVIFDGEDFYSINGDRHYFETMKFLENQFADNRFILDFDEDSIHYFFSLFGLVLLKHTLVKNIVFLPFAPVENLQVKAFLTVDHNTIEVGLINQYGSYQLSNDPLLTTLPKEKILLRDIALEARAERFIKRFGFVEKDNRFRKTYDSFDEAMKNLFLLQEKLPEDWEVTLDSKVTDIEDSQLNIEAESVEENRYLAIHFSIDDVEDEELNRVVDAIAREDRFVELRNGRILDVKTLVTPQQNAMIKQLRKQTSSFDEDVRIPIYQSMHYADALEEQLNFQDFYQDLTHPTREEYKQNPKLKTQLSDYQLYAVQWLNMLAKYQLGGLLADEMGLGKTVQTIAFLLDYLDLHPQAHPLILSPASVLYNWVHELKRFAPHLDVSVIDGSVEEREEIRKAHPNGVWICSYNSYRNDQELYQSQNFDVMVLDEAQALKNERTELYQSIIQQPAGFHIGLSGTPLENNLQEFWALMQIILPGLLPDKKAYQQLTVRQIRQMVSPFVLRRKKSDVSLQLPEKRISDRFAPLETEQKTIYLAYLEQVRQDMLNQEGRNNHIEILSAITRLRQICCHPLLINPNYKGTSGKFEYFKDLLKKALENKKRILIFSQFTKMLDIIGEELDKQDVPYFTLKGNTRKMVRQEEVDRFNSGERDVFLISLRAGGIGLNLTGADTVFLYDLWWNPSVEEQAIGRAHRIGQTKDITVYRLITEGTIEEQISKLQEEKRTLFDQVFDQEEMKSSPNLSLEDLKYILGMSETEV